MFSEERNAVVGVEILVFKTNFTSVNTELVTSHLKEIKEIIYWNFDLEDCDRIFRVKSYGIMPEKIIEILGEIGILAIELED